MTNFNLNQGSLMRTLLVLSAFCVNFGAANAPQDYSAPVTAPPPAPVYYTPHQALLPPPVVPTSTYVTFPTVYVPTMSTVVETDELPPKLQLFCPRRCFIRLNRFGREVCRCPERNNHDNNNLDLLLAFSLFGGHNTGGGSTVTPPPVNPPPVEQPYE